MNEYTHKLTLVQSTHDAIRTKETLGCLINEAIPEVGRRFNFVGAPLELPAGFRLITTSPVKKVSVAENGLVDFETENSTYKLERLLNG